MTNRLSVLLDTPPSDLTQRLGQAPIPVATEWLAVGICADLLSRLPDIQRAERLAAAQCARIGVATADLYPHIAINGTIASSAEMFWNLLEAPSFYGSVVAGFQWNILNYGRLRNNIRLQDARFQDGVSSLDRMLQRISHSLYPASSPK